MRAMAVSGKGIMVNIVNSFFAKAINVLCIFIAMPLTLDYVSKAEYGIWLTIYSILAWFTIFDFGLANGLKNKFTEAIANNDPELASRYVSTTYIILAGVAAFIFMICSVLILFTGGEFLLDPKVSGQVNISILLFVITGIQLTRFMLEPIITILIASHKISIANWINASGNVLSLIALLFIINFTKPSLILLGLVSTLPSVLIIIAASIYFYRTSFKQFAPSVKKFDKNIANRILSLGGSFFIIQIAGLVIFSTDNLIILKLFSAEEVVPYNISYRYFSILYIGFGIILAPFWPAFTFSYTRNDLSWIQNSVKKLIGIWGLFLVAGICMYLLSAHAYKIWLGADIFIPMQLNLVMLLFTLVSNWNNIFSYFLNGVSKIRMQTICAVVIAVVNIPLSIFFSKYLGMGISGVMVATCSCLFLCSILQPIQYYLIINKRAPGVWNK